jgi:autotransporter-associated beta strand protein
MGSIRCHLWFSVPVLLVVVSTVAAAQSSGNRLLGIDVSAWQGNISQTTWNNLRSVDNRHFVFVRATRGGTTGVDKRAGGFPSSDNTTFTLSQRYDDPYFVQNMNRATAAGMFAGSYHFARPEIIASTTNSGGIANAARDEADHYMQMAGAFMRPGYLLPTFDLETGDGVRTDNELAQYSIDFSDRVYETMGIRPMIYINGNYAANVLGGASTTRRDQLAKPALAQPSLAGPAFAKLWIARYTNQANPDEINVQTGHPNNGLSSVYGPWDDYGSTHPWVFWQYASTGRLTSFNSGNSNLDFNVLHGGLEYLKDQLVPAVWWTNTSGDWSTLANWNSGQNPTPPIRAPDQLAPIGTQTMPTRRLPGAAGTGPTSGQHDTVILDRPNADITVTLSTGSHNIRKLYLRETFRMTGGSLTVNYVPVPESTPTSMQVSSAVSLSGGASLNAHTIRVDATRTLTAGDASLTFNTLTLDRGTNPATLSLNGDVVIAAAAGGSAAIGMSSGTTNTAFVDFAGGIRTVTVANGAAAVDLNIAVPIINGGLIKAGLGTMQLSAANAYTDPTTVAAGTLRVANPSGVGFSNVFVAGGATLAINSGTTLKAPGVTVAGGELAAAALAVNRPTGISSLFINSGTIAGAPAVSITSGGILALAEDTRVMVGIGGLTIDQAVGGGRLDLGAGQLTIAANGVTAADLRADILAGRNGGGWNGTTGVMSSAAASLGGSRAVGYVVAGDGSARVSFAAPGDVDLSGTVDVFDLVSVNGSGTFANGIPSMWSRGDFNYDGLTDVFDLVSVNTAGVYGRGNYFPAPALASGIGNTIAVPEPGGWALIAIGAAAAARLRGRGTGMTGSTDGSGS